MAEFHDNLGGFFIPPHLLEAAARYIPPAVEADLFDDDDFDAGPIEWTIVKKIQSTSSSSIHTVERKGNKLRCTCQGFRIPKRGYCKHTNAVKKELGI